MKTDGYLSELEIYGWTVSLHELGEPRKLKRNVNVINTAVVGRFE